jgi:hypothetical protein
MTVKASSLFMFEEKGVRRKGDKSGGTEEILFYNISQTIRCEYTEYTEYTEYSVLLTSSL